MKTKPNYSKGTHDPIDALNEARAKLIISELTKLSVEHFLIAPGSRSTPLAFAAAENPLATTTIHFDERGLAYHALGIAKVTKRPACLICTSGTALANFYPALIEASMDHIPMIILAADRPSERRDIGSNQTIDQVKMFGRYLRWEYDLACSDPLMDEEAIKGALDYAFHTSATSTPGPVLINAMFRKPLVTGEKKEYTISYPLPKTRYHKCEKSLSKEDLSSIASEFIGCEKGLIVVGKMEPSENREAILNLAMRLQWPIFADTLSGLRSMGRDSSMIPYYNHILKNTTSGEKMLPEVILHFGNQIVSKPLWGWLRTLDLKAYYHVSNTSGRYDPYQLVTEKIEMPPCTFAEMLCELVKNKPPSLWLSLWKEYSLHIEELISTFFEENADLSEPLSVYSLLSHLHEDIVLFFGNSLPIRYADNFFFPREKSSMVFCNRGVSGIEGNLATILGLSKGAKKPALGVIGDVTFLHDVNSLALLQTASLPTTLILLNNFGGGIFHFLPASQRKDLAPEFLIGKHTLSPKAMVEAFGAVHKAPKDLAEFQSMLETSLHTPGMTVIEVVSDGEKNLTLHKALDAFLSKQMVKTRKDKEVCYFEKIKR